VLRPVTGSATGSESASATGSALRLASEFAVPVPGPGANSPVDLKSLTRRPGLSLPVSSASISHWHSGTLAHALAHIQSTGNLNLNG